jgi:hypothetical protein
MPWHDKNIVQEISNIQKHFGFTHLVETGTDEGIGARFWSKIFQEVYTCEIRENRFQLATRNTQHIPQIHRFLESSTIFVPKIREKFLKEKVVYLLDAHGYKSWPLFDEIKALKNTPNCAIIVHDFHIEIEPHLGFDRYTSGKGKISATLGLLKKDLLAVNSDFLFYHNTYKHSELYSPEEILDTNLFFDKNTVASDRRDWSKETYRLRGVLFALPGPLVDTTLSMCVG